jgi:hypothetical protein
MGHDREGPFLVGLQYVAANGECVGSRHFDERDSKKLYGPSRRGQEVSGIEHQDDSHDRSA